MIAEIQGLRALAVLLVLVFHVWPEGLPGGFVGVDVFFVISGYLITGGLIREARRDGTIQIGAFYARRARRLLPAASLVLLATLAGSVWLLPASRWQSIALEVAASAAYVQNWLLATTAVDYWASDAAASPLQHFWSLAIEEQFYLLWPVMLLGAVAARVRWALTTRLAFVMASVFVGSLAASVVLTERQHEAAYFLTHTRAWELAAGGLLALAPLGPVGKPRDWLAALGLLLILVSAILLSPHSSFPGYLAAAPVFGTALVLYACKVQHGPAQILRTGLMRWVGDRSYSIYLWHWPLVVWYGHQFDGVDPAGALAICAVSVGLGHLTFEFVEQPVRRRKPCGRRAVVAAALSISTCALGAGVVHAVVARFEGPVAHRFHPASYPGPAALIDGADTPLGVVPTPPLSRMTEDLPVTTKMRCHQGQVSSDPSYCVLGDHDSPHVVAVVGDSHAQQWIPALERVALDNRWKLLTFTKSVCAFSEINQILDGRVYDSCHEWRARVLTELQRHGVRQVITSHSRLAYTDATYATKGLLAMWKKLEEMEIDVVALADTPWLPFRPDDCLASRPAEECAVAREDVLPKEDPLVSAARSYNSAKLVDMTDYLCTADLCQMVVGNIVVWRDRHHITATYSAALAPYLAQELTDD